MKKGKLVAASAVFSIPLIFSGMAVAQQVICNPHCSPTYGNSTSDDHRQNEAHRGEGLRNANEVAGEHGFEGRDNARLKQDERRPGGSGIIIEPPPPPPPAPVPAPDSGGTLSSGGTLDPGGTLSSPPTCSLC